MNFDSLATISTFCGVSLFSLSSPVCFYLRFSKYFTKNLQFLVTATTAAVVYINKNIIHLQVHKI